MILGEEVSALIIDGKPPRPLLEMVHEDLPEPKGVKGDEFLQGEGGLGEQDGPVLANLLPNGLIGQFSRKRRDILPIQKELGILEEKSENRFQALVIGGLEGSELD